MKRVQIMMMAALVALSSLVTGFFPAIPVSAERKASDLSSHVNGDGSDKSVPALLNYQGYLATADSGAVNETLAMTFRLFDSAEGGTQLWSETHPAVVVNNGGFTLLLGSVTPFPADLFDGSILYLQMEVGSEIFSPRKTIVSVAYSQLAAEAEHALTANYATEAGHSARADTADYSPGTTPWTVSGNDVYRETGNVGIGTATPSVKLEVAGTVDADGFTIDGTPIGTSSDSYWSNSGNNIHYSAGNVGVGMASPTARLHVVDSKGHEGSLGSANYAVYGKSSGGNEGHLGSSDYGAYGQYDGNGNEGVLGGLNAGVEGYTPGDVVAVCGIYGEDKASGNKGGIGYRFEGVYGYNATTGNEGFLGGEGSNDYGVGGTAASASGKGVYGSNSSSSNFGWLGGDGEAVYGENAAGHFGNLGGSGEGVYGQSSSGDFCRLGTPGKGVEAANSNGNMGDLATTSYGVYGEHNNGNGGVIGSAEYGVYGLHHGGNLGYLADSDLGAYGEHTSGNWGSLGSSSTGVYGEHNNGNYGTLGFSDHGAFGYNDSNGNLGFFGGSSLDYGAYGEHGGSGNWGALGSIYYGTYGYNSSSGNYGFLGGNGSYDAGAYGQHSSGNFGHLGGSDQSVYGQNSNGNIGMLGGSYQGAYGIHSNGNWGYLGNENHGVYGKHEASGNSGHIGSASMAIFGWAGSPTSWAGFFDGKVDVTGDLSVFHDLTVSNNLSLAGHVEGNLNVGGNLWVAGNLSKGSGEFKIDHPLDPENKYLHHSFVESPDMMNIYNGNVVLNEKGEAQVDLPDWFGALNRDFRYQLTCVGGFAPVYISEKISGNRFAIAGGEPGMEVSWQVTGIRQDPYANLHRIPVEEDKPPEERGRYLHSQAYGQPEEKSVDYAVSRR